MIAYRFFGDRRPEVWDRARTALEFLIKRSHVLVYDNKTIKCNSDIFSMSETVKGPIVTLNDMSTIPYYKIEGGIKNEENSNT